MLPDRKFNLILIDASVSDLLENKKEILSLCYPKDTHMDFNIVGSLYLITKGVGITQGCKVKSGAKIVFSGLGADEIFGGYSRYWVSFRR